MSEKNSFVSEVTLSLVLIILALLLLTMPGRLQMMILVGLLIVFALFTALIWREAPRDEREAMHRMLAGRAAFFAGSTVLVLGIAYQSFTHSLDFWLPLTLIVMVVAKIVGLVYSRTTR